MVVISVEVPDRIAKKVEKNNIISIDNLYNLDEDIDSWSSVEVWEKASVVLDYLKEIK